MCTYLLICSLNIDLFVCEFIRMYFFSCTPTGHPLPLQPRSSTATCNYECMHVCMYACTQLCNYVYCRYVFPADYFKPLPWEAMRWVSRGWLRFVWQLDAPMQLSVARKQQSLARRRTERNQNRYKATSLLPLVRVGPFGS